MARPLREVESNWCSSVRFYCRSTIECLERLEGDDETTSRISGRVGRSGTYTWLVRGSALEVVDAATGQRLAACRFGWRTTKKLPYVISCVEEYASTDASYLVVGLKSTTASLGMLGLFDPVSSRVVKAIAVPQGVSAISEQLHLLFDGVAVGTDCGHVYLLDLRLDDKVEEFDEWNPSHMQIIDPANGDITKLRETARSDGAHIAYELGAECHMLGSFSYASPDGEIMTNFSSHEVKITSLKYIRQLDSLVVGYNFGCFQVWNLEQHTREFSSSFMVYNLPVTHIVYQEPENDPRPCSYLWIARGPAGGEEIIESPTTITLYQLTYDRKESLPGYGRVLKDFVGAVAQFEHQLTGDPYHLADATSCGSSVLCFYTLERDDPASDVTRLDDSSDDTVSQDLTLAVCVWEAPSAELHSSPTCHLAVFDINRWYHSQMPSSIREAMYGSKDPTCPFFSVYSVAKVLNVASPDALIDVYLNPNEIARFSSVYGTPPEQFFWASSLTFDIICLMETGIVRASFLGTQQQILDELNEKGVTALSEAHDYFHRCWAAALMPKNFNFSRAQEKTFQVEALLSVALEHNQLSFIISCIKKLGEDNVTYAGCNLRIILEWAWDQVIQIKQHLDRLCIPLFDGTGIFVDKQLISILDHYGVQLGNLVDIFQALSSAAPTTDQGLKEIESQFTVASLLHQYLKVILFFLKERLLPELFDNNEDGELSSQYYPGETFAQKYNVRRRELERLDCDALGSLMIDRLVSLVTDGLKHNLWETESRWAEIYPPPNLHALASLVLLEKIDPTSKLCIIYYSLLDLCAHNPQFQTKKVAEKFAAIFGLEPLLTNLFRGLWCLDHKDFKSALQLLTDSAAKFSIAPWQNSHIIRLFLNQGEAKKALEFIRVVKFEMSTPADIQLHLSVLINNGMVTQAFHFQRQCRDPVTRQQLLEHFFHGCQQTKNADKLLNLPLNKVEQEHLVRYFEQSPFPQARELLVVFYLDRALYVEAIRLNERLKKDPMSDHDPAAQRRASFRNALINKYFQLLPKVQQELALRTEESLRQKAPQHREVPRPKPLSTVVNPRLMSQTAVVNAALMNIADTRVEEPDSPNHAPFTGTPLMQKKPLLSDCHMISFPRKAEERPTSETKARSFQASPQQSLLFSPVSSSSRKDRARKLFKGANTLSLLHTPAVTKHLSFAATPNTSSVNEATVIPQSILKPARISRRSPSPSIISPSLPPRVRRVYREGPSWTGTDSDNEQSDITTQKKIRFKSPSPPSATETFAFTREPSHVIRATVERISEADEVVQTESESLTEDSEESRPTTENGPKRAVSSLGEVPPSDITTQQKHDLMPMKDNEDRDVKVVAVVDVDEDSEDQQESYPSAADQPSIPMHLPEEDKTFVTAFDNEAESLQAVAVVDLDEDDEGQKEESKEIDDQEIIRPSVVDPQVFMNASLANQAEVPKDDEIVPIAGENTPPPSITLSAPTTTSPQPVFLSPARISVTSVIRETPERPFMPLRDTTPVQPETSPVSSLREPSPSRHVQSEPTTSAHEAAQSDNSVFPALELSTSSSSIDVPEVTQNVSLITGNQDSQTSAASRTSPVVTRAQRTSPQRSADGTPISDWSTEASTMTPPISPPTKRVSPTRNTTVSPRARTPERRSPSRSSRSSPPLTRSAQRKMLAGLSTPHQSPSESPISFVTPVRKTSTSPLRKSPRQRKPVKLPATHGMTLRTRSCANKTTRCAKLPDTQT